MMLGTILITTLMGALLVWLQPRFTKLYWDVGGLFGVGTDVVSASIF